MLHIFIKIIVWLFRLDINTGTVKVDGNGDINTGTVKVDGNGDTHITSLEVSPRTIGGGRFYCTNDKLTSLEGAPQKGHHVKSVEVTPTKRTAENIPKTKTKTKTKTSAR